MRALTCLLMFALAAMLVAGCEPTKKDDALQPAGTAVYPEGQTPALEPVPTPVPPPVTTATTPTAPSKVKTPPKTTPATTPTAPSKTKTPPVKGESYTVKKGDSLSSIAKKFYNDANLWKKIADANKDKVHDKDKIFIGEVLVIPAK